MKFFIFFLNLLFYFSILSGYIVPEKLLICGVCKDVSFAMENNIKNIEELGKKFLDYQVIIYENNSEDNTAVLLTEWSNSNPKVITICEHVSSDKLGAREQNIARARNIVLSLARNSIYDDFKYLIMVDLDFIKPWPLREIIRTIRTPIEWDCVSANGTRYGRSYWDRYAYRSVKHPFGPELLGKWFWKNQKETRFKLNQKKWLPTYSAFGGLAIYKRSSIINFSYSGTPTEDLRTFYQKIILGIHPSNPEMKKYIELNGRKKNQIEFHPAYPVVCEHVTLHASMALSGKGKFFINPMMRMDYDRH